MGDGDRTRREASGITQSAARVGAVTMLSRVFGLARDTAFAVLFGTGPIADAFNLAFLLPNVFRPLVGEGNINPAFVPVFTEIRRRHGEEAAGRFLRRTTGAFVGFVVTLTTAGMVFAGPLVALWAGEWRSDPVQFALAVDLLRLLFPFLLFAAAAALASAALNARRQFAIPALAPILLNVCFLVGAAASLLWSRPEERIFVFAVGGLAGGLSTWLVQLPAMRKHHLPLGAEWAPRDPDVRRVARLMIPGIIALGVTQLNLFVDILLALRLEEGSLTALRLGNRVMLLPLGVIGVAVSTAALPTLARRAAENDRGALMETLDHTLRLLVTLLVPAAVGLALLAGPIVTLLFQYGAFTAERSTPMTAAALLFYSLGLPAIGLSKGLAQGFYSVQNTRTPVLIAAVTMGVNIVLNLILMGPFGLSGLAIATSVAAWLNTFLLARILARKVGVLPATLFRGCFLRTAAASAALALGVLGGIAVARGLPLTEIVERALVVALGVTGGVAALLLAFRILRHGEMTEIVASIRGIGSRR